MWLADVGCGPNPSTIVSIWSILYKYTNYKSDSRWCGITLQWELLPSTTRYYPGQGICLWPTDFESYDKKLWGLLQSCNANGSWYDPRRVGFNRFQFNMFPSWTFKYKTPSVLSSSEDEQWLKSKHLLMICVSERWLARFDPHPCQRLAHTSTNVTNKSPSRETWKCLSLSCPETFQGNPMSSRDKKVQKTGHSTPPLGLMGSSSKKSFLVTDRSHVRNMEILHQECILYAFHIISDTCQECSEHIRTHSKYWPPSPILLLLHDSFELKISIKIAQWCSVCSKIGSWLNHGFPPIQFSNHSFNTHIVLRSLPFVQTIPRQSQRSEKSVW